MTKRLRACATITASLTSAASCPLSNFFRKFVVQSRALERLLLLLLLFVAASPLPAQDRSNPFEITTRLPQGGQKSAPGQPYSPFDVRPAGPRTASPPSGVGGATYPAPAAAPAANARGAGPLVIQSSDPDKGKTSLLAINLLLLLLLAVIWVLFGPLYRQCLYGTVNSGVMKQLYTRRSGGELSALWIGYGFFNFALGFFLYLLASRFDAALTQGIWQNWGLFTLFVAGFTGLKQWLLWVYARLFPVRKEVSYYAFIVMVFCLLTGLFLVPLNLLVCYAPNEWRAVFLYGALSGLAGLYLFHLLRGGLVARNFLVQRPVHIMLYIWAVEIAPLLLIYRYLTNSIALT